MTRHVGSPGPNRPRLPAGDYWVALEHDSIWGDHPVPLTGLRWYPEPSPTRGLVAFGSIAATSTKVRLRLKHLLREIRLEDVRGRIIFIPVLNPSAFRTGTRGEQRR